MPETPIQIDFSGGLLRFANLDAAAARILLEARWIAFDARTQMFQARACDYAKIVLKLREENFAIEDRAAKFEPLKELKLQQTLIPHPHQKTALEAWRKAHFRGVASLPTGSGKTVLAVMAIAALKRSTIVLVPTIDLLAQWAATLERFLNVEVGILGGGAKEVRPVTVATYNSAVLQMEFIGNRFALLIADECHHLPGPVNQLAAAWSIAPYRLGLSATPESDAERDACMSDLLGETCIRIQIDELEGKILSPYEVHTIKLDLESDERESYEKNRSIYTNFLREQRILLRSAADWGKFLTAVARCGRYGQEAFQAYLQQRQLARSSRAKMRQVWEILTMHAGERIVIFTADNATAYELGRRYALPVLTHHTNAVERKKMLEHFRSGAYSVLVSSKVLNEGVDVPEAAVGVVLSGGGSIREHVQRLGRILRASPGKVAVLYELINVDTSEEGVQKRRREHRAYQSKVLSIEPSTEEKNAEANLPC